MKRIATLLVLVFIMSACAGSAKVGANSDPSAEGNADTKANGATIEAYCKLAVEADKLSNEFDNFQPTDVASVRELFQRVKTTFDDLAPKVPAEIKADFEVGRSVFVEFIAEFEKVDYDFTKFDAEATARIQSAFDNPAFKAATDRLEAYDEAKCGIAPNG